MHLLTVVLYLLICSNVFFSQNIQSSINGKLLSTQSEDYSFLIIGHLYGNPIGNKSKVPSSTILKSLDYINNTKSSFLILLGDNYYVSDNEHINNFLDTFAYKINKPIFNAIGNHDFNTISHNDYINKFGKTYFKFKHGNDLHLFLDTEMDSSLIIENQLSFFKKTINSIIDDDNIKNVFIYSHKLIWSVNNLDYSIVFENLNSKNGYLNSLNFETEIKPVLQSISSHKNIFWFSGDIGCSWSLPVFYDFDLDSKVTYIATGLGDTKKDMLLKVDVIGNKPKISSISLNENIENIKVYDLEYWKAYFKKENKYVSLFKKYYLFVILILLSCFIISYNYRKIKS